MRNPSRKVGPTQPTGNDSRGKASKARLTDGRRRPPVARRDRREQRQGGEILWRWFRSGPVIIVVEVERDLGSVFFALSYHSQESFRPHNDVEGIRLCQFEADVHIPWIPAYVYMPFGFSVRLRFDA